MVDYDRKTSRKYGYDVLVNTYEDGLRRYLLDNVFLEFGKDWYSHVPEGVKTIIKDKVEVNDLSEITIDQFFEELFFLSLKEIIVFHDNYKRCSHFFGTLPKGKFISLMDELNAFRRKIAHAKSDFSFIDLEKVKEDVGLLTTGQDAKGIYDYVGKGLFRDAGEIPENFVEEYDVLNNLPSEEYDLEGGFIGRESELKEVKSRVISDQDRIVTISGAGGVGKTAIALKAAYSFLDGDYCPFDAILWFSAKNKKLNERGVIAVTPDISDYDRLLRDLVQIVDYDAFETLEKGKVPNESYREFLYNYFSIQQCLLVIDNLETIISEDDIIEFIKNVPRNSKVLITSRTGLGEIERRYPLPDLSDNDAMNLFRRFSRQRRVQDLVELTNKQILDLVRKVRNYPLLIKWSIGQFCMGKNLNEAFSEIFSGESDIAKFSFNDVFSLLSSNAKLVLFSMVTFGEKPVSQYVLTHLSAINDTEFEDAIKELIITSLVYPELGKEGDNHASQYTMLTLTRGFIASKLDEDTKVRNQLNSRMYHLSEEIAETEKANTAYYQSLQSLGVNTTDEKVAFTRVKTAKNFYEKGDFYRAEENYDEAVRAAPNLSYALQEYSKFLFSTDRGSRALEMAKRAVEVDPENFHAWFNYGIILRRSYNFDEAIVNLAKAKTLNPKHLPIYNELGMAYMLRGQHDKAESEFLQALNEEMTPNIRHKIITLQFMAENYRRWAEAYDAQHNYSEEMKMLLKATDYIMKAMSYGAPDYRLLIKYWKTFLDFGICKCKSGSISEGKEELLKCITPWSSGGKLVNPPNKIVSFAAYQLAYYLSKEPVRDIDQTLLYIKIGFAHCNKNNDNFDRLQRLRDGLYKNKGAKSMGLQRKYGKIRFFNVERKYGIIDQEESKFIFFANAFRDFMKPMDLILLKGRLVSFVMKKSSQSGKLDQAFDIHFEE